MFGVETGNTVDSVPVESGECFSEIAIIRVSLSKAAPQFSIWKLGYSLVPNKPLEWVNKGTKHNDVQQSSFLGITFRPCLCGQFPASSIAPARGIAVFAHDPNLIYLISKHPQTPNCASLLSQSLPECQQRQAQTYGRYGEVWGEINVEVSSPLLVVTDPEERKKKRRDKNKKNRNKNKNKNQQV